MNGSILKCTPYKICLNVLLMLNITVVTSFQTTTTLSLGWGHTSNELSSYGMVVSSLPPVAKTSKRIPIFSTSSNINEKATTLMESSVSDVEETTSSLSSVEELENLKQDLVQYCSSSSSKPSLENVREKVRNLEELAEQIGIGQASSTSGLLNGEWELVYSPEDITRSSPFFWAFRRAFPDSSDQIFSITDSIPSPIKDVGPAYQEISPNTLVSRVKVATLGGVATSIMTTRCKILGESGLNGLRVKIETTKPEESTIVELIGGPLFGKMLLEKVPPPFPSGDALEQAQPGSSEVIMQTTFCDEALRISRNDDDYDGVYVWKRKSFGSSESSFGVDV